MVSWHFWRPSVSSCNTSNYLIPSLHHSVSHTPSLPSTSNSITPSLPSTSLLHGLPPSMHPYPAAPLLPSLLHHLPLQLLQHLPPSLSTIHQYYNTSLSSPAPPPSLTTRAPPSPTVIPLLASTGQLWQQTVALWNRFGTSLSWWGREGGKLHRVYWDWGCCYTYGY